MLPYRRQFDMPFWEEVAKAALAQTACFHGRNLSVDSEGELLVLRGVVKTVFQKELAYRAVRSAVGPLPIVNEIELAVAD